MITYEENALPESNSSEDTCNPYYLVKTVSGNVVLAMFIEDAWMTSYITKLTADVWGWTAV